MRVRYIAVMGGPDDTSASARDSQAARLAEALRENLRRRKIQARARKEAAHQADGAGPAPGGRNDEEDATDVPRD
jgi:hypothetical protein